LIRRRVTFGPEADADLQAIFDRIADDASPSIAWRYMGRLRRWLDGFDLASERGTRRDDIRAGVRIVGFERRLTVTFMVSETEVTILRVFYAGQDWQATFEND